MNDKNKKVVELELNDILPNRFQPRIKFNEERIYELSQSIKEHGVIQPIIVRPIGDKFEIVTGERRYKASVLAGLDTIPSIVLDLEDKDSIEVALIENVQREDLSPIEEAISYKKILDMGYLTQEELADKLGVSQSAIANKKRLLNLCDEVQEALMEKEISERHARSLLKITNEEHQRDMLYRIVSEKLTVRQLDLEIQKLLENNDNNDLKSEEKVKSDENQSNSEVIINSEKKSNENKNSTSNDINLDDLLSGLIAFDETKKEEPDDIINEDLISPGNESKEEENNDIKDENRENDEMNNMLNLDDEISYNSLKNSSSATGGKFFGTTVEDDEEKVQQPIQENKSVFNFSTGTVSDSTQSNSTVTRSTIAEQNIQNNVITPSTSSSISTSSNDMPNKIKDLLSPQGSSPKFETENDINQEHIFASSNPQNSIFGSLGNNNEASSVGESSIFANLMKSNDATSSVIDTAELQSFLDPSFVNGKKQENSLDSSQMNDDIFSKFIDDDFGGEINTTTSSNELESSNDLLAKTLFGDSQDSKIEEQSTSFELPELSANNEVNFQTNTEVPSILESPMKSAEQTESIFEQTPSMKIDSEKLDMNNLANSSSQTELISGLMASSNKPDLLAPMNSSNSSSVDSPSSSIFGLNQNTEKEEKEDTTENKEDENVDLTPKIFDIAQNYNGLTPDSSIKDQSKDDEGEENPIAIPESFEKPVFITATNEETDVKAPSTPIITDTTMSNLLSVEKEKEEQKEEEVEIVQEEIEENKNEEEMETPTTNNNIDIQPIIITDYNKQYDPVLPQIDEKKEPTIDFKQVLNMIRDLSNKIEEIGYVIDTEEIDLENIYQVVFNITKK